MEKNLKKLGVVFMLLTAIMFGAMIILSTQSLLVIATLIVVLVACVFIAHFLITKHMGHQPKPHHPIELLIILFADIAFGLFIGAQSAETNPAFQLVTTLLITLCGFIAFFIIFLKNPKHDTGGAPTEL